MTGVLKPCLSILPAAQRALWPALGPALDLGMVLYGGTAIALRLGHRQSVDFDFFSDRSLDHARLRSAMPVLATSVALQEEPNALTVLVPCGDAEHEHVKLSFYGQIGFGRVGEPDVTEDGALLVASLDDLMATKLKVVLQRVEAKDYRDVAAMVEAGVSLARGLASARQMYGNAFQPSESLKALVYFVGGDLDSLTEDAKEVLSKAVSAVRDLPDVSVRSRTLTDAGSRMDAEHGR